MSTLTAGSFRHDRDLLNCHVYRSALLQSSLRAIIDIESLVQMTGFFLQPRRHNPPPFGQSTFCLSVKTPIRHWAETGEPLGPDARL